MTKYEIIQMANEAGLNSYRIAPAEAVAVWERFAALVEAKAAAKEGGYVPKAAPEGWQLVQSTGSTQKCSCAACDKAANHGMRTHMSVCPRCGSKRCEKALNHQAECSSAPKP